MIFLISSCFILMLIRYRPCHQDTFFFHIVNTLLKVRIFWILPTNFSEMSIYQNYRLWKKGVSLLTPKGYGLFHRQRCRLTLTEQNSDI